MESIKSESEENQNTLQNNLNELVDGFGDALFQNKGMTEVAAADFKDDDVNQVVATLQEIIDFYN